jgi:hypothetical protein
MVRCAKCGASITVGSKFCVSCGARLEGAPLGPPTASGENLPNPFAATALATEANEIAKLVNQQHGINPADAMASTVPVRAEDVARVAALPLNVNAGSSQQGAISPRAHTAEAPKPRAPSNPNITPAPLGLAATVTDANPSAIPAPAPPLAPPPIFAAGTRVLVQWSDGNRYPGVVQQSFGTQCSVAFADGRQLWVESLFLAPAI